MADKVFAKPALNAIYNCETAYGNKCDKVDETTMELSTNIHDDDGSLFPVKLQVRVDGDAYQITWDLKVRANKAGADSAIKLLNQLIVRNESRCVASYSEFSGPLVTLELCGDIKELVPPVTKRTASYYKNAAERLHDEMQDMCCIPVSFQKTLKERAERSRVHATEIKPVPVVKEPEKPVPVVKEPEKPVIQEVKPPINPNVYNDKNEEIKEVIKDEMREMKVPTGINVPVMERNDIKIPVKTRSRKTEVKIKILIISLIVLAILLIVYFVISSWGKDDDSSVRRKSKSDSTTEQTAAGGTLADSLNPVKLPDTNATPNGNSTATMGGTVSADHSHCAHAKLESSSVWPEGITPVSLLSDEEAIKTAMGSEPTQTVTDGDLTYYYYGSSYFYTIKGTVSGWHTGDTALNVNIQDIVPGSLFTIGSLRREVMYAMGTPDCYEWSEDSYRWYYGSSYVEFRDDVVSNYFSNDTDLNAY